MQLKFCNNNNNLRYNFVFYIYILYKSYLNCKGCYKLHTGRVLLNLCISLELFSKNRNDNGSIAFLHIIMFNLKTRKYFNFFMHK